MQGYRAEIGFFPEYNVGMVLLWNCECAEPAGLMPMVFDKMLGLPEVDWAGLNAPGRAHTAAKSKRVHRRLKAAKGD